MTTTSLNHAIADTTAAPQTAVLPRQVALVGLTLTVAAVEFSIALSEMFFGVALAGWLVTLIVERKRPAAPSWMLPLVIYGGWTLVSAALSQDPATSFVDCKQLVLLLLVPLTYDVVDEASAVRLTSVVL